jgi:hypothetical protein
LRQRSFVRCGTILSVELRIADFRAGEGRLSCLATVTDGDGVCAPKRCELVIRRNEAKLMVIGSPGLEASQWIE